MYLYFVMNLYYSYACVACRLLHIGRSIRLSRLSDSLEVRFGDTQDKLARKFGLLRKLFVGQIVKLTDAKTLSLVELVR
jgi:hypothetical protein